VSDELKANLIAQSHELDASWLSRKKTAFSAGEY